MIKFLLLFFLFYLVFRFVGRLIFGYARARYSDSSNPHSSNYRQRKEGDVTINMKTAQHDKKINKDEGEYVNFEEIKD